MSSPNRYDEYPPSNTDNLNEKTPLVNNSLYNRKKQQRISNGKNDETENGNSNKNC
jgi:hypothetical protein